MKCYDPMACIMSLLKKAGEAQEKEYKEREKKRNAKIINKKIYRYMWE